MCDNGGTDDGCRDVPLCPAPMRVTFGNPSWRPGCPLPCPIPCKIKFWTEPPPPIIQPIKIIASVPRPCCCCPKLPATCVVSLKPCQPPGHHRT